VTGTQLIAEIERHYIRNDIADATWLIFLDFGISTAVREYDWPDLQATRTYSTVADTETVALSTSLRKLHFVRLNLTGPVRRPSLEYLPWDEFNYRFSTGADTTGVPTHWTLFGATLFLGPIPDAVYTVFTLESRWPSTFAAGGVATENPIARLDDFLVYFAVGTAYQTKNQDDLSIPYFRLASTFLENQKRAQMNKHPLLRSVGSGAYETSA